MGTQNHHQPQQPQPAQQPQQMPDFVGTMVEVPTIVMVTTVTTTQNHGVNHHGVTIVNTEPAPEDDGSEEKPQEGGNGWGCCNRCWDWRCKHSPCCHKKKESESSPSEPA